jgi:hypothetical protein
MTKYFDNLFSANHRALMIARHGGTEAMWIAVKELIAIKEDLEPSTIQ